MKLFEYRNKTLLGISNKDEFTPGNKDGTRIRIIRKRIVRKKKNHTKEEEPQES
jgi:hypothetical protein